MYTQIMCDADWDKASQRNLQDLNRFNLVSALTLSQNSSFIDVGANRGDYIKIARRYCKPRNIHAFEPIDYMASYLRSTFPEINVHELAVSDKSYTGDFFVANFDELSGFKYRPLETLPSETEFLKTKVNIVSLDQHLIDIQALDLIKIDVEGAEVDVMKGMGGLVEKHRPRIFVEHGINGPEHYGYSPLAFWEIVTKWDYEILTVDGENISDLETFNDSFFNWQIWNYLLIPKD